MIAQLNDPANIVFNRETFYINCVQCTRKYEGQNSFQLDFDPKAKYHPKGHGMKYKLRRMKIYITSINHL